jgi:zinc D-Ala-D-Ala carboxypeptidase
MSPVQPWIVAQKPMTGYPVHTVQHLLRAHKSSIPWNTVTGHFTQTTKTNVIAFQQSKGLGMDGKVGKFTWPKLIITIQLGSHGEAVKALQEIIKAQQLATKGTSSIQIDGLYGSITEGWVFGWQKFAGILEDGICGPKTWRSLLSGLPF